MFGAPQRQRGDRRGRVHAARRRPDAAVEDEQVGHVVTTAPGIDHRRRRIRAHLRRAEQVPAGFANQRRDHGLVRAGGFQRFLGALQMKLQQPSRVLRHAIDDLRRGDAVGVLQHRIEHDAILFVGQILGDDAPHGGVAETLAKFPMKARAPDRVCRPTDSRASSRAGRRSVAVPTWRRARSRATCRSRRTRDNGCAGPTGRACCRDRRRTGRRRCRTDASSAAGRRARRNSPVRSGKRAEAESSSSRGVPMPLAAEHGDVGLLKMLASRCDRRTRRR